MTLSAQEIIDRYKGTAEERRSSTATKARLRSPTIRIPQGSQLLHADQIEGKVYLWALVPVESEGKTPTEYDRKVGFFLTGDVIPEGWVHVDTVVIKPSGIVDETQVEVLHVFDGIRDS